MYTEINVKINENAYNYSFVFNLSIYFDTYSFIYFSLHFYIFNLLIYSFLCFHIYFVILFYGTSMTPYNLSL